MEIQILIFRAPLFSGVIAQDLQRVLPDAIVQSGDTKLSSGEVINNLLLVDKNRLNMECVGALKALGNKTENLDQKIVKLEEFIEKSAVISRAEATKGPQQTVPSGGQDNRPPAKGLAALTQYFWLSGDPRNSEHEKKLIRAYKILLTLSLIVIALG